MVKNLKLQKVSAFILVLCICATLFAFAPIGESALAVPSGKVQPIVDELASATAVYETTFTVDYSLNPVYHIFFIRTGYTGFTVTVTDIDGNNYIRHMNGANMASPTGREWTPLWNVGNHTGEVTYQLSVKVNGTFEKDCAFVILVDTYEEGMKALSGPTYRVPLERFLDMPPAGSPIRANNLYRSFLVPIGDMKLYYSFVATGNDTISFQSAYEGLRFRIIDPATGVSKDSHDTSKFNGAHSVDPNGSSRNHFTRWRFNDLQPGKEYYIELYRASNHQTSPGFVNSSYALSGAYVSIAVGGPRIRPVTMERHELTTTLRVTSSTTFADASIPVSGLPASAFVFRLEPTYRGTTLSNIQDFRYRSNSTSPWITSVGRWPVFDVPYTYLGTNNRPANATWGVGYRASFPTLTITPGILISYYYELGNFVQGG